MLNVKNSIYAAATVIGILSASVAAFASPATSTVSLNVRTGPGTSFNIVDQLDANEVVDVTECHQDSWCYVSHDGPNGWVSVNYLRTIEPVVEPQPVLPTPNTPSDPNCSIEFTIDANGPSVRTVCSTGDGAAFPQQPAPVLPTPVPAAEPKACLYTGVNYTGAEYCTGVRKYNSLGGLNDLFASLKLFDGAKIRVCLHNNFAGSCRTYNSNRAQLHSNIYKKASSMQIYTGATPGFTFVPILPVLPGLITAGQTKVTRTVTLKELKRLNLDTGSISFAGADLQFRSLLTGVQYIKSINGAKISVGNLSNRGYLGCKAANFSSQVVTRNQAPVGSYICVKTNQNRISQYRVLGYTSNGIRINFRTYKN